MRKNDEITNLILNNSQKIIQNISNESIDVYSFLKAQFDDSNVTENYLFQFVYRSFYRLDNAGLTTEFKTEYFNILEEYRESEIFDFENILQRLYNFQNHKGQNTFQFSFVTKMQNTIFNDKPIYDREVAEVFAFKRPSKKQFSYKLNIFQEQLTIIEETYNTLIKNQSLNDIINLFDLKFPNHNLHEMKKFDFIFWSAGKVTRKENQTE